MKPQPRARWLERALLFTFAIHAVAMASMAVLLLPAMPGGGTPDDLVRMRLVAEHAWQWRFGWLPWQLTALSDLLLGFALVTTPWIPKRPAIATMLVTMAAVVPDQLGEFGWVTRGVDLARAGDLDAYLAYEARVFVSSAVWGALLYTVAALGWTWCFVAAKTWSRPLTIVSAVLWPLFAFISVGPVLPLGLRPSPLAIAAGNALGFVLLELWLVLVLEEVLRRSRPDETHGRLAPWRHPSRVLGAFFDRLANSRFARALFEPVPPLAFLSDISDVIYVNYVVDAARLDALVPVGLELQRIGPGERFAVFTFLTFRHGHFGPRLLGPLRALLPSPIQSNWRIHVRDPASGALGIYFVTTAIDATAQALGARLMAEALPMHVLATASIEPGGASLSLDPGGGSGPDVHATFTKCEAGAEGAWSGAFPTWEAMLAYVVPQDRALSTQPWADRVTRQEIRLDIPLDACEPLDAVVTSRAVQAIAGDAAPFCFRVPSVRFRFESEERSLLAGRPTPAG